ncbi:MAG: ribulose-1,5-biphosphate synthetase [Planctomycetes bacterium ADurb.Bin126]|nr:MAG: ribulose-1,5-biphosphate synthetase [Planctomycetes bacterium ADurb.Bin126]HOD81936.1 FAD-dependent oxidoreductase [Phycisphaerae bacterium]HQL74151.1 FAD-dependent oxidoreductase [Phycisphaerae bacterium]
MASEMTRREWMKAAGAALAAAAGTAGAVRADDPTMGSGSSGKGGATPVAGGAPSHPVVLSDGKVIQPSRELPVLHRTQVLVVGGGPAGVSAAIAAKRAGADVTLVERYNHFGGLWTGGLVLYVYPLFAKDGTQVVRGIGGEMLDRIAKLDRGSTLRKAGSNPTVDSEAAKYMMVEMVVEAGVKVFLHCWGVEAIMDGSRVRGAVFESKSGRQAILADLVIDTTGDGDLFASAGAGYDKCIYDIGLVSRIGNLDKIDRSKGKPPTALGSITPVAGVNWVNMRGPKADGLDVATLTQLELNHRKHIWQSIEKLRAAPGYEKAFLLETAPQLGVRLTRLLEGTAKMAYPDMRAGKTYDDVVGVGGCEGSTPVAWQIPYGILVPRNVEGLLTAGRSVSADFKSADVLRLIAICYVTGHAAGVAGAVCAMDKCPTRKVDLAKVQGELKKQGAYLG